MYIITPCFEDKSSSISRLQDDEISSSTLFRISLYLKLTFFNNNIFALNYLQIGHVQWRSEMSPPLHTCLLQGSQTLCTHLAQSSQRIHSDDKGTEEALNMHLNQIHENNWNRSDPPTHLVHKFPWFFQYIASASVENTRFNF